MKEIWRKAMHKLKNKKKIERPLIIESKKNFWLQELRIGLRRFWMILILIVCLCTNVFYIICAWRYSPQYVLERNYDVSIQDVNNNDYHNVQQRLVASLNDMTDSVIKQDMLDRSGGEFSKIPIQIHLKEGKSNSFIVTVSSDNYYNTQTAMDLFCENLNGYIQKILNVNELVLIQNDDVYYQKLFEHFKVIVTGIVIGVVLCLLWLGYYVFSRKTIRGLRNIYSLNSWDCVQTIPGFRITSEKKEKDSILFDNSLYKENLYTYLEKIENWIENESNSKIIMITSSIPKEGKTVIASNLAMAFAEKGKKVTFIETNLRNTTTHIFEESNWTLEKYFQKNVTIEELAENFKDNLLIISSGSCEQNISDIFDTDAIKKLLSHVEKISDYVVIDAASLVAEEETIKMLELTDIIIYAVSKDYVLKEDVEEGINILQRMNKESCACIVTSPLRL